MLLLAAAGQGGEGGERGGRHTAEGHRLGVEPATAARGLIASLHGNFLKLSRNNAFELFIL